MHRTTLIRQIVLGLVLGSILLAPTPEVQAQWAVYDHPNWVLKFKEMVEDANRWVTTVNNYAEMYTKAAEQLMTLGGILDKVERTLARNKDLITTWSNVGKSVRGVLRLRRQLENMVRCRIQSIQSIADRLRNGVFDMEANARDLENYLKHTTGKTSEEAVANLERLANMDATLDRLRYDLHVVEARIAEQQEALKQYEALLEAWEVKPDDERYGYSDINTHIEICKQTISALEKQRSEIITELEKRVKRYGVVLEERGNFGKQVKEFNDSLGGLTEAKQEIIDAINEEFEPDNLFGDEDTLE
jgi:chromosome segregation ATPase